MNGVRRKVVPNRIFTERFGLKRRILNSQTDPSCEVQHLSVKFRSKQIPAAEHHREIQGCQRPTTLPVQVPAVVVVPVQVDKTKRAVVVVPVQVDKTKPAVQGVSKNSIHFQELY